MKGIITRRLQKQGAFKRISGLTGLCVYLFYPNLFPSQINSWHFPPGDNQSAPLTSRMQ